MRRYEQRSTPLNEKKKQCWPYVSYRYFVCLIHMLIKTIVFKSSLLYLAQDLQPAQSRGKKSSYWRVLTMREWRSNILIHSISLNFKWEMWCKNEFFHFTTSWKCKLKVWRLPSILGTEKAIKQNLPFNYYRLSNVSWLS